MGRFAFQATGLAYFCIVQVEIITIGDELLLGQTVDTNSAWMGQELVKFGYSVHRKTTISDEPNSLIQALDDALGRVQVVLITGGLGPTLDDRTKDTLAAYFKTPLVLHQPTLTDVQAYFERRGLPFLEVNRLQAMLPTGPGTAILRNPRGTAQGMWFERADSVVVSMPGVPHEMKGLMEEEVMPRLNRRYTRPNRVHRTMLCFGRGESYLSELLGEWEGALESRGVALAYLPSFGQVRIRLSAVGADEKAMRQLVDDCMEEAAALLHPHVASLEFENVAEGLGACCVQNGYWMAVAESFTGGAIASALTHVPGASSWFRGGVVAYTDEVKMRTLGVSADSLEQHGAVSGVVALEMARNVQSKLGADWGLSTTGYAGPGTSPEVGHVFIAAVGPNGQQTVREFHWGQDREVNISRGVTQALHLIWSSMRAEVEDCQKKVV